MSIVVFWLEPDGTPGCQAFGASELLPALQHGEAQRRAGMRHVVLSSELPQRVGESGVAAVEQGRLPGGERYEFTKAHRGAGPRRGG